MKRSITLNACSRCGQPLEKRYEFCPKCNARLKSKSTGALSYFGFKRHIIMFLIFYCVIYFIFFMIFYFTGSIIDCEIDTFEEFNILMFAIFILIITFSAFLYLSDKKAVKKEKEYTGMKSAFIEEKKFEAEYDKKHFSFVWFCFLLPIIVLITIVILIITGFLNSDNIKIVLFLLVTMVIWFFSFLLFAVYFGQKRIKKIVEDWRNKPLVYEDSEPEIITNRVMITDDLTGEIKEEEIDVY